MVSPGLLPLPTVPGRQGRPENHLFLLAVLGVFGVPGTVGGVTLANITKRVCQML